MSYSIRINGHGASEEKVRAATQLAIDSLAADSADSDTVTGSYSGSDRDGTAFEHNGETIEPSSSSSDVDEAEPEAELEA